MKLQLVVRVFEQFGIVESTGKRKCIKTDSLAQLHKNYDRIKNGYNVSGLTFYSAIVLAI